MTLLLSLLIPLAPARACEEPTSPASLVVDTSIDDTSAPSFPDLKAVTLEFLAGGKDGCAACPDLVELVMTFGETDDDRTAPDDIGYDVTLLTGALPEGITLPTAPFKGPVATFRWAVDPAILKEDLVVTLEVRSVDEAGNVSDDTVEVGIEQSGIAVPEVLLGCNQGRAPLAVPLLGLALAALRRRRRDGRQA